MYKVKGFIASALLVGFCYGIPALAESSRLEFVADYVPGTRSGAVSAQGQYVATDLVPRKGSAYRVLKFNARKGSYVRGRVLRTGVSTELCGVTDHGQLVIHDYDSQTRDTYNARGKRIGSEHAEECGKHFERLKGPFGKAFSAARIARLRELLCTVPADETIAAHGEVRRVFDILAIKATLPGGKVLAEVIDQPINYEAVVYDRYAQWSSLVLINPGDYSENYCMRSQLSAGNESPGCQFLAPDEYDRSTPFLSRFLLPDPSEAECDFTITQDNSTGIQSSATTYVIEHKQGEYQPVEVTGSFSTPVSGSTPRSTNFRIAITGCGYTIEPTSDDPRLRLQSFGIGNLYCSHV